MIEDHERQNFQTVLAARHADAAMVDSLTGYDYSRGRAVHLTLYRVTHAPETSPLPAP
jgi:hypothetical protein